MRHGRLKLRAGYGVALALLIMTGSAGAAQTQVGEERGGDAVSPALMKEVPVNAGDRWVFKPHDQVMVFLPAPDIQSDAFILGIVKKRLPDGRYRIRVTDYVEGHDYGLSCEPLPPEGAGSEYGKGWIKWEDTRKLSKKIDYAVAAERLMPAQRGYEYAISRNNIWMKFARWLSDAPVLYVDELEQARKEAQDLGLKSMDVPFELAIAHRRAFYSPEGAPYWPHEVVPRLIPLLKQVEQLLQRDPVLKKHFFSRPRDGEVVNQSTYLIFTLRALDKIVQDARDVLYEEDVQKVAPETLAQVRQLLKALGVRHLPE